MSEIEKMYKLADIKAKEYCDRDSDACMTCCPEWENRQDCWKYKSIIPSFTSEKQIELIKWLAKLDGHFEMSCTYNKEKFILYFYFNRKTAEHHNPAYYYSSNSCDDFAELLATQINELWKDLKPEEKQQVKGILE